jgi:hypothetical protein
MLLRKRKLKKRSRERSRSTSLQVKGNSREDIETGGDLEIKRKIKELVFPYGILVDTKNRTYLTSKVNSLFLAKSQFQRVSEGSIKKLPTKNDEESSLVAGAMLPDLRPGESEMGFL